MLLRFFFLEIQPPPQRERAKKTLTLKKKKKNLLFTFFPHYHHHHQQQKKTQLALWFNLLETASASVRAGDALSAYLWLVTESNRAVGWLQGAVGVAQLAAALPAGWAADHPRCRRDTVLKGAAALGFVSALAFGSALIFNRSSMVELFVAVALLGAAIPDPAALGLSPAVLGFACMLGWGVGVSVTAMSASAITTARWLEVSPFTVSAIWNARFTFACLALSWAAIAALSLFV